jgi:hypothetical protein
LVQIVYPTDQPTLTIFTGGPKKFVTLFPSKVLDELLAKVEYEGLLSLFVYLRCNP